MTRSKRILLGLLGAVVATGVPLGALAARGTGAHASRSSAQAQLKDHCIHEGLITICYPT